MCNLAAVITRELFEQMASQKSFAAGDGNTFIF